MKSISIETLTRRAFEHGRKAGLQYAKVGYDKKLPEMSDAQFAAFKAYTRYVIREARRRQVIDSTGKKAGAR